MQHSIRSLLAAVVTSAAVSACANSDADLGRNSPVSSVAVRGPDFIALAKNLQPGVVNVSALVAPAPTSGTAEQPAPRNEAAPEHSQGSGFIIDPEGHILTNAHVIERAKKVIVRLVDKREFQAEVIGKDPHTDVAIIKIAAKEPLRALPLGNSDELQVGEWVMAVGNPFGLDSSVSSGIVSAKGRHLGQAYDRLIQTDANLNPGSSGGPLVNLNGQVVGISKAIVSQGGGNIGISFATPINLIKEILPQLRTSGKVTRGWAGLAIQEITPGLADSLGLATPDGALVAGIVKGGPAERSGVKVGDVILDFAGRKIIDAMDLPLWIARTPIDQNVELRVRRDHEELRLSLQVGVMPESPLHTSTGQTG